MSKPSTNGANGANGRDGRGRFAKGNAGGPGNPMAGKIAKLRAALIRSVGQKDLREVVAALLAKAKQGDVAAAKELFDRTLGRPTEVDLIERLEQLEATLGNESE